MLYSETKTLLKRWIYALSTTCFVMLNLIYMKDVQVVSYTSLIMFMWCSLPLCSFKFCYFYFF